jgi:DNA-binding GntR family transcriptional regulator
MPTAPPLYLEIADKITAAIRSGDLRPGAILPSTTELADQYGVSTATAYRAVKLLHERGLVLGRRGKGVYVAEHPRSA